MTPFRRGAFRPVTAWVTAALVLTSCEAALTPDDGPLGGGSLDQSVADAQAKAPEPAGEQLSHEVMRDALQEHANGTVTDTDDWWPHMRDLHRELQMLRVQPADCKTYVTTSALPVPSGALGALVEDSDSQTVMYTFEDSDSAQDYLQTEHAGIESCDQHTVIRELGDTQVEAITTLEEIDLRTGAEEALAIRRVLETDGTTQNHLAVLLRQGAHMVISAGLADGEDEDEDAVVELEAAAALLLSEVVGEEILAPEPEPEPEPEDEDEENDDDADGTASGDDSDE